MSRKHFLLLILFICTFFPSFIPLHALKEKGKIIIISERVGEEIDREERDKFRLFQRINGFQSAVFIKLPDNRYLLKIAYLDENTGELKIERIQQSEASIKNRGDYIDRFEEIQAAKHQYQNLLKPQTVSSDSGKIKAHQDTVYQEPGAAFFFELFGRKSINIDFRINKWSRFGLGMLYFFERRDEEGGEVEVDGFIPNIMYYLLCGKKHSKFEIGVGIGVRPVWRKDVTGDFPLALHSVIGYRYQKKKGALFRVAFTPVYFPDVGFAQYGGMGISFGYSF